eukprot:COSAG02_NODE_17792_length_980_cov_1.919410_1_plen_88_part_01
MAPPCWRVMAALALVLALQGGASGGGEEQDVPAEQAPAGTPLDPPEVPVPPEADDLPPADVPVGDTAGEQSEAAVTAPVPPPIPQPQP